MNRLLTRILASPATTLALCHARAPNAWRAAFMQVPRMSIPSPDSDVIANPPGFDRSALPEPLATEITAFFETIPV